MQIYESADHDRNLHYSRNWPVPIVSPSLTPPALPQSVLSLIVCPALDEEFCEPSYPVRLAQDEERAGSVAAAAGSALVGHGPVSLAAAAANSHA